MRAFRDSAAALAALVALPVGVAALALRPAWREGWRERIGAEGFPAPGSVWVHGASVGEISAAARLIDRLRERGQRVVASTTTLAGRAVMRRSRPDVPCQLAPLDHPWCAEAALARVAPAALVLIETELWPFWIAAARRRAISLILVSARLSDRSYPRYRRLRPLLHSTLGRFDAIGARTPIDRERFIELGADPSIVSVSGDLKLEIDEQPRASSEDLERALGAAPLFVAGSTHAGEEVAALDAFAAAERAGAPATLVIAPRRVERAGEVVEAARQRGRIVRRRSALGAQPLRAGEVVVLDTLGELASLYARSAVAFVGGTLAPIGGHNVLEPVLARRPVIYGPHTQNVSHAVEILERCGAGRRVRNASELESAVLAALRDPEQARARGEAGWQALQLHRGSVDRAADLVLDTIAAAAGRRGS